MNLPNQHLALFETVNELIASAKQRIASTANHELTLLYWQVGKSIKELYCKTNELPMDRK